MKYDANTMHGTTLPKFFLTIPAKIFQSKQLTAPDKLIFEIIYTMTSVVGDVHVSDTALAQYAGLSATTVKRSVSHLKHLNLIGGD